MPDEPLLPILSHDQIEMHNDRRASALATPPQRGGKEFFYNWQGPRVDKPALKTHIRVSRKFSLPGI